VPAVRRIEAPAEDADAGHAGSIVGRVDAVDNRGVPGLHAAINDALWSRPELPPEVETYHRFVHAVLGATIAGWALALVLVVRHALAERQPWAWWCVLGSTLVWFVPDTIASVAYGVWPNAIFNVGCLVALVAPLALMRGGLRAETPSS
jgi:hypothetical protein